MNYDGQRKHHTEIGERVFIGCDTLLRAPVAVGDDASTGGGAVVTRDVPPGALAVGMPARVARRVRSPRPNEASAADGVGEEMGGDQAEEPPAAHPGAKRE